MCAMLVLYYYSSLIFNLVQAGYFTSPIIKKNLNLSSNVQQLYYGTTHVLA